MSFKSIGARVKAARGDNPTASLFLNDLNYSIMQQMKPYTPSATFKPSALTCTTLMYWHVTGEPQTDSSESVTGLGMMESGTDRHERLQAHIDQMCELTVWEYVDVEQWIQENNITDVEVRGKKGYETKCYSPKYNLSFQVDGILRNVETGDTYILEIKTEGMGKHNKRTTFEEGHLEQATAYGHVLNINQVMFLYECRDTLNKKAYVGIITELLVSMLLDKFAEVNRMVEAGKPVICEVFWLCKYCNYRTLCVEKRAGV